MQMLHHPIYHFIHGERLYFLLIQTKLNIPEVETLIKQCMNKKGLEKLKGSYTICFTFGTNDVMIRVWAEEYDFICLLGELRGKVDEGILCVTPYMMEFMSTWHQRKLEDRSTWPNPFCLDDVESFLKGPLPEDFQKPYESLTPKENNRYFMFVEERFTQESNLFSTFLSSIQEENAFYQKCFPNILRISLYSYYSKTHRGVLIKGQTDELDNIAQSAKHIIELFPNASTTTYICFRKIPIEASGDSVSQKIEAYNQNQPGIVYNLLKSHDCYEELLDHEGKQRKDVFCNELGKPKVIRELFLYTDNWWLLIQEFRKIFKWIAYRRNKTLIDYLRGEYVSLEKYFNDELKNLKDLAAKEDKELLRSIRKLLTSLMKRHGASPVAEDDVIKCAEKVKKYFEQGDNRKEERFVSFGNTPRLLGELTKLVKLPRKKSEAIKEIIKKLGGCVDHRNAIMHGDVMNLFEANKQGVCPWIDYTINIIKLKMAFEYNKEVLEEFFADLNKLISARRGTEHEASIRRPSNGSSKAKENTPKHTIRKTKHSTGSQSRRIRQKHFRIALSFADTQRSFVAEVADCLSEKYGEENIFYDKYFEVELARKNMNNYITNIYANQSDLNIPFFSSEYKASDWCMREWEAIRSPSEGRKEIMIIRFDNTQVSEHDPRKNGHVNVSQRSPKTVARMIIRRYESDFPLEGQPSE